MQLLIDVKQKAAVLLEENASTLLTAGGVVGTVATAVLTGRASITAYRLLEMEQESLETSFAEASTNGTHKPELSKGAKFRIVAPHFIPPVLAGTATITSIVMANRMSAQKAAALAAAYGLAENRLTEYREKVAEKLTGPKTQQIDDEIAQDRVNRTPGGDTIVIVDGEVLCFDQPTGRYFRSTMEKINKAVNATNAEIIRHNGATASYFYDELELDPTTWSEKVGWGVGEQVSLKISTVMSKDNKPCLAIDFQTMPSFDWDGSWR